MRRADEASPTTLPGEFPEAKNLLLGEGQSLLRAHLLQTPFEIPGTEILGRIFGAATPPGALV